jgi:hypothetical protein
VVAPVLGSYVFFKNVGDNTDSMQNVQWTYLAIAIFVFLLAGVFYLSPIPEITVTIPHSLLKTITLTFSRMQIWYVDSKAKNGHKIQTHITSTIYQPLTHSPGLPSIRNPHRHRHQALPQTIPTLPRRLRTILLYRISSSHSRCIQSVTPSPPLHPCPNTTEPVNYVTETRANTTASDGARFLAGAQGVFALGRFIGSFLMKFVRPRKVFLLFLTMCIIFICPSITQRGNTGMSMLYITLFFESIIFPTIVALGMRGLGKHSKRGSGYIVAGVCGGAVVPPILFAAADSQGMADLRTGKAPTALAMVVPLAFFVAAWSYPIAVNFVPSYKDVADKFGDAEIGVEKAKGDVETGGVKGDGKGQAHLSEVLDEK